MGFKKVDKAKIRERKHRSVRKKLKGTSERPRLCVYRSAKNIYVQLVDDVNDKTLTGVSTLTANLKANIEKAENKTDKAKLVGTAIAEKAKELNIDTVVFDRGGYIYHGRIKALADAAREGGLKF